MSKGFMVSIFGVLFLAVAVYGFNLYQQEQERSRLVGDATTYAGVMPITDRGGGIIGVVYTFDTDPPEYRGNPNFDWKKQFLVHPEVANELEKVTAQLSPYHWRQRMLITIVQKSEGLKTMIWSKGQVSGDPGHLILTNEVRWDKTIGPLALNEKS